ncbi:unnamed protein product [Bursaphelenchus xylophilus]|uniref:(pine wood nematode) hypothetical protein n=1 Tax=Bursaphelenchus xylophilus TaxID=6326 RepID=A0A1I7RYG9_BURXY|nr:unnamed protein product [Bursaphelenchus xylophilus]CAG9092704.1 unnamed protein product [Bursaphelenchus xylophilus]
MADQATSLELSDKPDTFSQRPLNIIKSHSTTSKAKTSPEAIDSILLHTGTKDEKMIESPPSGPIFELPKPKPRTQLQVQSTYFPTLKKAPSMTYNDNSAIRLTESGRNSRRGSSGTTQPLAEDITQDSDSNSFDEENFRKVFGMDPRNLASGVMEGKKGLGSDERTAGSTDTWFTRKESNCPSSSRAVGKGTEPPTRWRRFKNGCKRGLFAALQYAASCCIICYVVTPPIPALVTKKIAFHPPRGCGYYFVVKDEETGQEMPVLAKGAYGKTVLRVAVELPREFVDRSFTDRPLEEMEGFVVKTSRGNYLACVYVPCQTQRPEEMKKKVIIFAQPNSSNLHNFIWRNHGISIISFRDIASLTGADVYAFDYSGFGASSGTTLEKNIYADITAVFEYVRKQRPDCEIYLMGFSLGTAAVIHLASTQPVGLSGLILMAPFTSGLRVLCNKPNRNESFITDSFKSYEKAPLVDVPVFIAHGVNDSVIPFEHAISLLKRFHKPVPIELVEYRDHITIMRPLTDPVFLRIANFLMFEAPNYHQKFDKTMVMKELNERLTKLQRNSTKEHHGMSLE